MRFSSFGAAALVIGLSLCGSFNEALAQPYGKFDAPAANEDKGAPLNHSITVAKEDVETGASAEAPDVVGAHIIFALDASDSINAVENSRLTEGVVSAILEGNLNFKEGYAMTVVRFSEENTIGTTHIFYSEAGARAFIESELTHDPLISPNDQYMGIGISTSIEAGFLAAKKVFEAEKTQLNLDPVRRAVIMIGDGAANQDSRDVRPHVLALAQNFGVSVYGIPVKDLNGSKTERAIEYYEAHIPTPDGLSYMQTYGAHSYEVRVPAGFVEPAETFSDVRRSAAKVLKFSAL